MGFIAKGNEIILKSSDGSNSISYLYKYRISEDDREEGETSVFRDAAWGQIMEDLETPAAVNTWNSAGIEIEDEGSIQGFSHKYCSMAVINNAFSGTEGRELGREFNRNNRIDSFVKISKGNLDDITNLSIVSFLVKNTGSDEDIAKIAVNEYLNETFENVIAYSVMNRSINDTRDITTDYNDLRNYECSMKLIRDYTVQEGDNIVLVQAAILPYSTPGSPTLNIHRQYFVEFLGNNAVAPGTIGSTEINPDYKATNAINNYIMEFDDSNIIEVDSNNVLVIPQMYVSSFSQPSVYYGLFENMTKSFTKIALGYYDLGIEGSDESEVQEGDQVDPGEYVITGTIYDVTIDGTINNKICNMVFINDAFNIKAIM